MGGGCWAVEVQHLFGPAPAQGTLHPYVVQHILPKQSQKGVLGRCKVYQLPTWRPRVTDKQPASLEEGVSCFLLNLQGGAEVATTGEPQYTQGDQPGSLKWAWYKPWLRAFLSQLKKKKMTLRCTRYSVSPEESRASHCCLEQRGKLTDKGINVSPSHPRAI